VGDLSYRIDPSKIDAERQETLFQVEFFGRIFKELERRELVRRQAEMEAESESQEVESFTIQLLSVGNKVKAARVIAKQFEIPVSEALASLKELPLVLAEGATLEQAQAFKGDLEEAGARVEIIEE